MYVYFEIRKGTRAVSNGILVYEPVKSTSLKTYPDTLDSDGRAKTDWHSDWSGREVDVYCHTDGINSGRPAYCGRVEIKRDARYEMKVR